MCLHTSIKKSQDFITETSKTVAKMTSENAPYEEIASYRVMRAREIIPMLIEVEKLRARSQPGLVKSSIHWISILFFTQDEISAETPPRGLSTTYNQFIEQLREEGYQPKIERLVNSSTAKLLIHIDF